jgi:hypothetical protein
MAQSRAIRAACRFFHRHGIRCLNFQGGEPLLHPVRRPAARLHGGRNALGESGWGTRARSVGRTSAQFL